MFTEGCMVLIEGEYTVEETVRVLAMGHPPSEKRDIARYAINFFPCAIVYHTQIITWPYRLSRHWSRVT